jgi:hypothetical protein
MGYPNALFPDSRVTGGASDLWQTRLLIGSRMPFWPRRRTVPWRTSIYMGRGGAKMAHIVIIVLLRGCPHCSNGVDGKPGKPRLDRGIEGEAHKRCNLANPWGPVISDSRTGPPPPIPAYRKSGLGFPCRVSSTQGHRSITESRATPHHPQCQPLPPQMVQARSASAFTDASLSA